MYTHIHTHTSYLILSYLILSQYLLLSVYSAIQKITLSWFTDEFKPIRLLFVMACPGAVVTET